jgi:hypothetical protein
VLVDRTRAGGVHKSGICGDYMRPRVPRPPPAMPPNSRQHQSSHRECVSR